MDPIRTWPELKALALSLNLPQVTEDTPWGNPCLKAHGKMWAWWSPYVDAAVVKCGFDEREALMAADPQTFVLHPHYTWMRARLLRSWRDAAPKRWLKAWDAEQGRD